jgi:hypothetical protein
LSAARPGQSSFAIGCLTASSRAAFAGEMVGEMAAVGMKDDGAGARHRVEAEAS